MKPVIRYTVGRSGLSPEGFGSVRGERRVHRGGWNGHARHKTASRMCDFIPVTGLSGDFRQGCVEVKRLLLKERKQR